RKDRAPRRLRAAGAPCGGGRARIEVGDLTKVPTQSIDAEQLAGVPRILVQGVGRRADDDVNAVAERGCEPRVRPIEIRELQKARAFLEEELARGSRLRDVGRASELQCA